MLGNRTFSSDKIVAIILAAAITFANGAVFAESSRPRTNPMIHRVGLTIVDGNGNPIKLRGVNLGGWLHWEGYIFGKGILTPESEILNGLEKLVGPEDTQRFESEVDSSFITEADLHKISQLGFNVIRLPIDKTVLEDESHPYVYKQSGWALIDRALAIAERYHLYVVLDLHSAPGGQSWVPTADPGSRKELVWNSDESRKRTIALWQAIAMHYSNAQVVAGYDLLNEPGPPDGHALVEIYSQLIAAIRSVDPDHMIVLEGSRFASDFSMFSGPLCDNQVYSFHMYSWFGDNRAKQMEIYRATAARQQIPFWVGEFGENTYDMIRSTVAMFNRDSAVAGWAYWTWKRAPTRFPGLEIINVPTEWQSVMNWIVHPLFNRRPSRDETLRGMAEFLNAVSINETTFDGRMAGILAGGD